MQIEMKPFFLDHTLPPVSIDKRAHYVKKFGAERVVTMIPQMMATARQDGIELSYGGKVGSTLLSHRLLRYTQRVQPSLTNQLADALFKAYFEEEKDIADVSTLAQVAGGVGLDEKEVTAFLQGKEEEAAVQNEVINAYRKGIEGVPHFVFDGQYEVSGGEKPETFLQVFERLGVH